MPPHSTTMKMPWMTTEAVSTVDVPTSMQTTSTQTLRWMMEVVCIQVAWMKLQPTTTMERPLMMEAASM